jgi:transcriptional regulator with XRE-family HTH domain
MSDKENEFLSRFAHNLAHLMEARGRSAVAVAEASGLKRARIERLLLAEVEPGAIEVMRHAKALDVTPGDLID